MEGYSLDIVVLLVRALLLALSFIGLCASVRTVFNINRFIAPYIVSSGVIVVLMISGMLRILEIAFWAIYALGFIGLVYSYLVRRRKPDFGLIAAMGAFCCFLVWRFYFCPLNSNDDISHWGLVARHLLRHDTFPDKNATYVFFQSYPLGAASFIYYVCKTIANHEGLYFVASNFLLAPLFLPVFSLISEKRKSGYIIGTALFVFLFHHFRNMLTLQVDATLAFFGIGIIASIAYYRNNTKYALLSAIPGMIAVVYIKNSGMFFGFIASICLAWNIQRRGGKRSAAWKTGIGCILGFVCAYLLWILHIRLSFPAALESKHAISISAYAHELSAKGATVAVQVLKVLVQRLFGFSLDQIFTLAFTLGCAGMIAYGCLAVPSHRGELRKYWRALLACAAVYGIWFILLCGMYLFSMPEEEALMAASFWRYNGTGTTFLMGLTAIVFFLFWGREGMPLPRLYSVLVAGCMAFMLAVAVLYPIPKAQKILSPLKRTTGYFSMRSRIKAAREEYQLEDDDRFLIFCNPSNDGFGVYANYYYQVKYEFETTNILMIAENDGLFLAGSWDEKDFYNDLSGFFETALYECDALLLLDSSELFESQLEAFLESYTGDISIIKAY